MPAAEGFPKKSLSKKVKVNKLCDANKAGTSKYAKDCTIIFTEGDSAKTMAIAGIAEVGRDYYGVYPLRGKILNVRDAPTNQIMNCLVHISKWNASSSIK